MMGHLLLKEPRVVFDPKRTFIQVGFSSGKLGQAIITGNRAAAMYVNIKNLSLVILAITAFAWSRIMFAFINDPEGQNLLVVTVMAAVIYLASVAIYLSSIYPSLTGYKRTTGATFIQALVATCFYFGLR